MREGLSKVAVFRDEAGELHRRSAVCTHLGCIVGWNKAGVDVGLPLPRLALRRVWPRRQWTGEHRTSKPGRLTTRFMLLAPRGIFARRVFDLAECRAVLGAAGPERSYAAAAARSAGAGCEDRNDRPSPAGSRPCSRAGFP